MTWLWIVCMTFARNLSLSGIIPYFHISFVIKLIKFAGNKISLTTDGLFKLGAGIFNPLINPSKTSSSNLL